MTTIPTNPDAGQLLIDGDQLAGRAYLNTAAEGLPLRVCEGAVGRYLRDKARGEPGRVGMWQQHERARQSAGKLFGVDTAHVALVSSTTEALNAIAHGIEWRAGDEVVFTSVEFPSNMFPWVALREQGVQCRIIRPRDGLVRVEDIIEQINDRTRLVTVSQVSYATGQYLDPVAIWEQVRTTNTLLCVDATQAAGRTTVRGDQADFVVASAFKWLNSIHGAAILTVGPRPLAMNVLGPAGWLSAESCYAADRLERFRARSDATRFHAGMPNFDSVYALADALAFHTPAAVAARRQQLEPLVEMVHTGLQKLSVALLTPEEPQFRAGIVAFTHERADQLKMRLAEKSVHVHADDGRVRASIHWYNGPADIERYLKSLATILD